MPERVLKLPKCTQVGKTVKESKNANQQLNGVYRQIFKDMGHQKIFGKNSKMKKMWQEMS